MGLRSEARCGSAMAHLRKPTHCTDNYLHDEEARRWVLESRFTRFVTHITVLCDNMTFTLCDLWLKERVISLEIYVSRYFNTHATSTGVETVQRNVAKYPLFLYTKE